MNVRKKRNFLISCVWCNIINLIFFKLWLNNLFYNCEYIFIFKYVESFHIFLMFGQHGNFICENYIIPLEENCEEYCESMYKYIRKSYPAIAYWRWSTEACDWKIV